jgi:hypothetical protein
MGSPTPMTREELAALLTEHRGDIDAAAEMAGTTRVALYQRVRRAGLSMRVSRWGAPAVAELTAETPPQANAFALAALELAVENEGLRSALIGAEGVIDALTGKVAEMAEQLGATR